MATAVFKQMIVVAEASGPKTPRPDWEMEVAKAYNAIRNHTSHVCDVCILGRVLTDEEIAQYLCQRYFQTLTLDDGSTLRTNCIDHTAKDFVVSEFTINIVAPNIVNGRDYQRVLSTQTFYNQAKYFRELQKLFPRIRKITSKYGAMIEMTPNGDGRCVAEERVDLQHYCSNIEHTLARELLWNKIYEQQAKEASEKQLEHQLKDLKI